MSAKRKTEPVIIGNATLYLGDCREILPLFANTDKFDACITDPPYGIGEAAGKNKSRGKLAIAKDYGDEAWDDEPISTELIMACVASADYAIVWGGNYYPFPPSKCWLVWDKVNGESDFADCELAWTNLDKAVRKFEYMWNGMLRANKEQRGDHPTQKPIGLMKWCISQLHSSPYDVIDPFMGSGTTGVACMDMGVRFTGIEKSQKY